jgi:hypothetical protein
MFSRASLHGEFDSLQRIADLLLVGALEWILWEAFQILMGAGQPGESCFKMPHLQIPGIGFAGIGIPCANGRMDECF